MPQRACGAAVSSGRLGARLAQTVHSVLSESIVINKRDLVSSPSAVASSTGTSQLLLSLFKEPSQDISASRSWE